MAFIHLLKNGYRGKLGETVGQKWKNELTLRTYQATNNSKSEAQLQQRVIYKENISESSIVYSSLVGVRKNVAKGMNLFNLFTSQWSKTKGALDNSWVTSKIFDKPNLELSLYGVYSDGAGFFSVYVIPPEIDINRCKNFALKGFFGTLDVNTQVLSTLMDVITAIGVGRFENDNTGLVTDNGLIVQSERVFKFPNKTLFQLSFDFENKHYVTNLLSDYLFSQEYVFQYYSVNYIWQAPYFS